MRVGPSFRPTATFNGSAGLTAVSSTYCDGGSRARAILVRHASSDAPIVPSLHSTLMEAASVACFGAAAAGCGAGAGAAVCGRRAQPRELRKTSKTRLLRIGVASACPMFT